MILLWFRRNQNLSITVKNYVTSNGSETTHTVSGRSPGSFKVLDINGSDEMYVGGLMDNTKVIVLIINSKIVLTYYQFLYYTVAGNTSLPNI